MAVSVVAGDSIFQPQNIRDAKIFAEDLRVVFFRETWISFLHFAQQTLFRGEQRSAAVDIDATAFQDHAAAFVNRPPHAALPFLIGFGDDGGVFLVIRVFGPAVENEIVAGNFAGFVSNADWTGDAHPAPVSGDAKKIHSAEICAAVFQHASYGRFRGAVLDDKIDALHLRQVADDFSARPRDDGEFSGPVGYFVRRFDLRGWFHWEKNLTQRSLRTQSAQKGQRTASARKSPGRARYLSPSQ